MYKKLQNYLRDFFAFNQTEIKGFIFLILLVSLLIFFTFIFDYIPEKQNVVSSVDSKKIEELIAKIEIKEASESRRTKKNIFSDKYSKEIDFTESSKTINLFTFDPNLASVGDLTKLGIPTLLSERIVKYRSKGGVFRKKEDLLKIYSFPNSLYQKLAPYIILSNTQSTVKNTEVEKLVTTNEVKSNVIKETFKVQVFDLNRADTNDLKKLKGIASKRAIRIIQEREKLGGFYSVEQVRYIWGLDSLSIDELLKYGRVNNPSIRKIKINEVTLEEFKHPYLRPYIAKAIIAYRQQHGNFSSKKDLENIKLLDAQTLEKLLPYLSF
ncbi:helix-hairpin-helix domain-containing protein [Arcicella sp. DC2W]|uniref:Helix-hairpin-helix domain-containing protein n=1 Tax=Arcicella gelida TaxID=2984195 RepID=A0ABU5SBN0_9BACT|nr:helix-hairpin-helix domain-containing protein [Arcicella sp. DC2W]MEA5405856.1 helix-hairpin-helix domain-containing protein [Arcicella sp. DC2W]